MYQENPANTTSLYIHKSKTDLQFHVHQVTAAKAGFVSPGGIFLFWIELALCLCKVTIETHHLPRQPWSVWALQHFFALKCHHAFGRCTKLLLVLFWAQLQWVSADLCNQQVLLASGGKANVKRWISVLLGSVRLTSTITSHSEVT